MEENQLSENFVNVLVVDDSPDNLRIITEVLKNQGWKVRVATSGKMAIQTSLKEPPHLILLDVNLPDLDGFGVCRRLKETPEIRDVPIIFLTGRDNLDDEVRAFHYGAVDFVTKPIEERRLVARVRTHLELTLTRAQLAAQYEELQKAAELREEVDRMTQQDLKRPLNSVLSLSNSLLQETKLDEQQIRWVKFIQESAQRMLHQIQRTTDMYRMETGTYLLTPENVDIVKVVRSVFEASEQRRSYKNLRFRFLIDNSEPKSGFRYFVWVEELLFFLLLDILIKYAVEAAPNDTVVTLSCNRMGNGGIFSVHNMGVVPENRRENFFAKQSSSLKKGTDSLGLYSAWLIAKVHGGSIEMETRELEGTVITAILPGMQEASLPDA